MPHATRSFPWLRYLWQYRSVKGLNVNSGTVRGLWPTTVVVAFGKPFGDLAFDHAGV